MTLSFLDILKNNQILDEDSVSEIIEHKKLVDKGLYETLITEEKIEEEQTLITLAKQLNLAFDIIDNNTIDLKITQLIPETIARKEHVIALFQLGETLTIASSNPCNTNLIEELEFVTKCYIDVMLSPKSNIIELINYAYSYQDQKIETDGSSVSNLFEMGLELVDDKSLGSDDETTDLAQEAPIAKLVDTILTQSIAEKASDIHIEPEENVVKIRFRVDGLLKEIMAPPKKLASPIISRLKILAELDITETRKPQDGRLTFILKNKDVDFRVSTVRTIAGEKMVLRMLEKSDAFVSMEKIGLDENNFNLLQGLIQSTSGIVLVCGPTGSGKTSTLYSCLSKINTPEKNIITIEDPVEFNLDGINQIPVNPKIGVDFVSGLSAVVRQDPDVIMIGEIRDIETADIAIQAALTGHLVFSTLHTRSAAGSVTRLINMGVQPFLINSAFIGVIGQRLVRQICPNCKKEASYDEFESIKEKVLINKLIDEHDSPKVYHGSGCKYCNESGYKGRLGIFEILTLSEESRELIINKASSEKIRDAAMRNGMKLMLNDGIDKIIQGLTTIEEIVRVVDV